MQPRMVRSFRNGWRAPDHSAAMSARCGVFVAAMAVVVVLVTGDSHAGVAEGLPADAGSHVHAQLLADVASIAPGHTFRAGVLLTVDPGWHVNWLNPGDAGLAPAVAWHLPAGFKPTLIDWPLPERFKAGPLVIFGYGGSVLLTCDVKVPASLKVGTPVDLAADVSWLACAEACVPGSGGVRLQLPVEATARPDDANGQRFDQARARCPLPTSAWSVSAQIDGDDLVLDIQSAADETMMPEGLFFFPYQPGLIENAAPQTVSAMSGIHERFAYAMRIQRARIGSELPPRLTGILVCPGGWTPDATGPQALDIDVPIER
jgi:DsbC/DsbD-like thiol-disulfide interchange protein